MDDCIYASTDLIHRLVFGLPPGGGFRHSESFRTVFAAAEVLTVLQGCMVIRDPETGETHMVKKGESAFFRRDTRHHAFAWGAEELRVLEFLAPPPSTGSSGKHAATRPYVSAPTYERASLLGRWPLARAEAEGEADLLLALEAADPRAPSSGWRPPGRREGGDRPRRGRHQGRGRDRGPRHRGGAGAARGAHAAREGRPGLLAEVEALARELAARGRRRPRRGTRGRSRSSATRRGAWAGRWRCSRACRTPPASGWAAGSGARPAPASTRSWRPRAGASGTPARGPCPSCGRRWGPARGWSGRGSTRGASPRRIRGCRGCS